MARAEPCSRTGDSQKKDPSFRVVYVQALNCKVRGVEEQGAQSAVRCKGLRGGGSESSGSSKCHEGARHGLENLGNTAEDFKELRKELWLREAK